jgi:hypothetical protein
MPFLPLLAGLWGNPLSRLIIIGVGAFAFGFLKGFQSVERVDIAALTRNVEAARDAAWQAKLSEANQHHEQALALALEAAASVPSIADDAELNRLCDIDAACRDKGRKRQ